MLEAVKAWPEASCGRSPGREEEMDFQIEQRNRRWDKDAPPCLKLVDLKSPIQGTCRFRLMQDGGVSERVLKL
jgi:hypothetical protein